MIYINTTFQSMKKVIYYLLAGVGCILSVSAFGRVPSLRTVNPVRNSGVRVVRNGGSRETSAQEQESKAPTAVVETKSVSEFVSRAYSRVKSKVDWSAGLQYDDAGCYEALMANFPELSDICVDMIDFIETHDDVVYIKAGSYLEGVRR